MHSVQYTYWQLITALFMCIGNKINYIEIEKKNKIKTKTKAAFRVPLILPCVTTTDGWSEIKSS